MTQNSSESVLAFLSKLQSNAPLIDIYVKNPLLAISIDKKTIRKLDKLKENIWQPYVRQRPLPNSCIGRDDIISCSHEKHAKQSSYPVKKGTLY